MTNDTAVSGEDTPSTKEDFAALFAESLAKQDIVERTVATGTVLAIENDMVLIDVGLKAEGRVSLKEFAEGGLPPEVNVGDEVEIYIERLENRKGEAVLSREKARREAAWIQLEVAFEKGAHVKGSIFGRVKGGFTVDLSGAVAFLPGSQVDIRPERDITPLMGVEHEFVILKMDRHRGNIVVSRRAVLEESRAEARAELLANLKEGQTLDGVVKNLTNYGAFVDLGGVDGLLHVTDIAWRRINHPSEALSIGETVKVQVIRFNPETQRISLGMKQLLSDPWEGVELKYAVGAKFRGRVTNITDYGAFVDLGGVDGLLHVTDIAWRRINHPSEALSIGQTVNVQVIRYNSETQRISLGMKQLEADPWEGVDLKYPVGTRFTGRVSNITDYGAFVELEPGVEGLVHVSEMSWTKKNIHPGKIVSTSQEVEVMVLEVDPNKRRISLGLKQCHDNPWQSFLESYPVGTEIEGDVKNITEFGLFVGLDGEIDGMVHLSDIDWTRQGDEAVKDFKKGDVVRAKVLDIDAEKERISLGIKQIGDDPLESILQNVKKGDTVTCTVSAVTDGGIEVTVADKLRGFIRRSDLARERSEQRPDRFAVGDRVDARIVNIERKDRRLMLSIKAHEFAEEKQAMAEFGSSDSGASLGDILGAAINRANEEREAEEEAQTDEPPVDDAPDAEPEPEAEPEEVAAAPEESSDQPADQPADEPADEPAEETADGADDAVADTADAADAGGDASEAEEKV